MEVTKTVSATTRLTQSTASVESLRPAAARATPLVDYEPYMHSSEPRKQIGPGPEGPGPICLPDDYQLVAVTAVAPVAAALPLASMNFAAPVSESRTEVTLEAAGV